MSAFAARFVFWFARRTSGGSVTFPSDDSVDFNPTDFDDTDFG